MLPVGNQHGDPMGHTVEGSTRPFALMSLTGARPRTKPGALLPAHAGRAEAAPDRNTRPGTNHGHRRPILPNQGGGFLMGAVKRFLVVEGFAFQTIGSLVISC